MTFHTKHQCSIEIQCLKLNKFIIFMVLLKKQNLRTQQKVFSFKKLQVNDVYKYKLPFQWFPNMNIVLWIQMQSDQQKSTPFQNKMPKNKHILQIECLLRIGEIKEFFINFQN